MSAGSAGRSAGSAGRKTPRKGRTPISSDAVTSDDASAVRGAGRTAPRGRARARHADPAAVPPDVRDAILAAHAEGLSQAAIARRVGRSRDTVRAVVGMAGRDFDRAGTAAATEAAAVDRRAQRVASSGRLLDVLDATAERLLGDRYLTPHEWASLARATVDLSNAHARLVDLTPQTEDRDHAIGILGRFMEELRETAGEYEHPEEMHPTAAPSTTPAPEGVPAP